MRFAETPLAGVCDMTSEAHADARGHFRRTWCVDEFAQGGIAFAPVQSSLSANTHRHTLRGMHWQTAPATEQKLVRCLTGAVWDVALDLRPHSATDLRWHAATLSAEAGNALFLPQGVAHGFISLTEGAVVEYLIDAPFSAPHAKGARWNDPAFAITWPADPKVIADRDRDWPDFHNG